MPVVQDLRREWEETRGQAYLECYLLGSGLAERLYGYRKFFQRRSLRLCDASLGWVLSYDLAKCVRCHFNNE